MYRPSSEGLLYGGFMEILAFILCLALLALLADIHEKYHERQLAKSKEGLNG